MNLVAYDNIDSIVNKRRSWIDVYHKVLFTREVSYRKYNSFGKKYNAEENKTIFYIIFTDDEPEDRSSSKTVLTSNGCIKIGIKGIWEEAKLNTINSKYINAFLKPIDHADDGDIYEFCPIT